MQILSPLPSLSSFSLYLSEICLYFSPSPCLLPLLRLFFVSMFPPISATLPFCFFCLSSSCLYSSLRLCFSLLLCVSLCLFMYVSLRLWVSRCLYDSLRLITSMFLSISLSVSVSLCQYLCRSPSLCFSPFLYLSSYKYLSPSVSGSMPFFISTSLSAFIFLPISLSLSHFSSTFLSISPSRSVSVSLRLHASLSLNMLRCLYPSLSPFSTISEVWFSFFHRSDWNEDRNRTASRSRWGNIGTSTELWNTLIVSWGKILSWVSLRFSSRYPVTEIWIWPLGWLNSNHFESETTKQSFYLVISIWCLSCFVPPFVHPTPSPLLRPPSSHRTKAQDDLQSWLRILLTKSNTWSTFLFTLHYPTERLEELYN